MGTDNRKQSLYFPNEQLDALQREANRLDRSLSWVVQRALSIAMPQIQKIPGPDEYVPQGNGRA